MGYLCGCESNLYYNRNNLFDHGYYRNISSYIAYYAFFAAYSRSLFPGLSPVISVVAESKIFWTVHTEFPGAQSHSFTSESNIPFAHVDNNA